MELNNSVKDAFEQISATQELRQNTTQFLRQELSRRQGKPRHALRYVAIFCAAVAVIICGLGGAMLYSAPTSYISVDVNPSIELSLNRFDHVIEVKSYNEDGALILQNLSLKNKHYTAAVELLLADETFESFLATDSLLSFTVVSAQQEALLSGIQQCQGYAQNAAECHVANAEFMEAAHHSGLSFGKYQAFLELSEYDKTITAQDCKHLSMREIRDLVATHTHGENTEQVEDTGAHHGGGNGNGHRGNNRKSHD